MSECRWEGLAVSSGGGTVVVSGFAPKTILFSRRSLGGGCYLGNFQCQAGHSRIGWSVDIREDPNIGHFNDRELR